jgi:hypothetical protein
MGVNILKVGVSKNPPVVNLDGKTMLQDMAQSRFFTISIADMNGNNPMGIPFGNYTCLPLKNMTYTMQGIDIMTLSVGLFKDIPIPVGLRLPKLSLTLTDTDEDTIENQFRDWYNLYTPNNYGCVGYLEDLVKIMTYRSYKVDGTPNKAFKAPVILADDFTYTRDYETNDLKTMEANILIVGEGQVI